MENKRSRLIISLAFLAAGAILAATLTQYPREIMIVLGAAALVVVASWKPEYGLYALILSLPVIDVSFSFGQFSLPLVDTIGLLVFSGWLLRELSDFRQGSAVWKRWRWPLIWPFIIFFSSALLSALFADWLSGSIWYAVRWILFFYLVYIFLPYNIIDSAAKLRRSLLLLTAVAVLVAVDGLASLFFQDLSSSFFRIQPLAVFGVDLIGTNHNLIAEFLVIAIFFVLALRQWLKIPRQRRLAEVVFAGLLLVTLGTFSRTGWIVIGLQAAVYFVMATIWVKRKSLPWPTIAAVAGLSLILLLPFAYQMQRLQESNVSSTENRLLLLQISWQAFLDRPLLGHGPGTFVDLVNNNIRFRANYGDPLDSHGVWQKVLAEQGLIGVGAFAALGWALFLSLARAVKRYPANFELLLPLFIGALGGFVYQFFNTSYYKGKLWLPIALALAAVRLVEEKNQRLKGRS